MPKGSLSLAQAREFGVRGWRKSQSTARRDYGPVRACFIFADNKDQLNEIDGLTLEESTSQLESEFEEALKGNYADLPLPHLPHLVGASCSKMEAPGNDPCGAYYQDLAY